MKNYLFIITLVFVSLSWSQSIEFKVTDEDNNPIPSAQIYFTDLNYGGVCDSNGIYRHEFKIQGLVSYTAAAPGFKTQNNSVEISGSSMAPINVVLKELHFELHEVIVKSGIGELEGANTSGVERMDIEQLNEIGGEDLGKNLQQLSGVNVMSFGSGISKPVIRGLSGVRIITFYDGLRIENQQWGNDHGLGITSSGAGSVEIVKGPSSLLYGSDAIGGVLFISDASFVENDHHELRIKSSFSTNAMSTNSSFIYKTSKKDFKVNIFGSARSDSDYQLPNGKFLKNSNFINFSGGVNLAYHKKKWFTNLRYNALYNSFGLAGHTHDSIASIEDFVSNKRTRASSVPLQSNFNNYLLWQNKWFFKNGKVKFGVGYTRTSLKEHDEKVTIPAIDILQNNITTNLLWEGRFGDNKVIIGNQNMFGLIRNGKKAEEKVVPNYNQFDAGIFGVYQRKMNKWLIQLGIRYDLRNLSLTDDSVANSKNYQGVNFSAGTSYNSDHWGFRFNISSGIRPPHVSELYSNGPHHGSNRYELGDENLKSEKAYQLDVEWEGKFEHLSFTFNPFFNYINNYITIQQKDTIIDGHAVFQYDQFKDAFLFGGEIGIHYHPHFAHWLHLESAFSYVYTVDGNNQGFSFTPPGTWDNTIKVEFEPKKIFEKIYGTVRYTYVLPQNNISENELNAAEYHMLDIGLGMKFKMNHPLTLNFGVQNALNYEYVPHLSNLRNLSIPNPGYNIYIGIQWDLNLDKH